MSTSGRHAAPRSRRPRPRSPRAISGSIPSDPAFIADPYPVYRRLRDEHPILWNPETSQWLVSRHADVNRLLRDRRLGRTYLHQATHAEFGRPEPPAWHAPFHELNDAGMLDLEPPDHTRLRRLVLKAFTPRTVEAMRTPDPGHRRRPDRRLRRRRRDRSHRRLRRAAAGHGHRRAARYPGGGPPPAPALVGRLLPDVRARPARGVGAQGRRGQP